MSAHEEVQVLQAELGEKLDALKSQGLDEADLQVATTNLIIEFGAKVQAATLAKAQATASTAASSTTIFAEQSEKTNLKSLSSEDLHSWGEKLKAKQVLTGRAATEAQLMSWTSERQKTIIGRAFRLYRFPDGSDIHNAENWLQWANSESICDIIKSLFFQRPMLNLIVRF